MTALLEDRVALWLADHPYSTVSEIARGVGSRDQRVREVLEGPLFTFKIANSKVLYRIRVKAWDGQGRADSTVETDVEFLQRVLSDGQPHNLNEILRRSFAERGCGLTVHSRAADLRKRGVDVRNWKDGVRGAGSWYQLGCVDTPAGTDGGLRGAGVSTEPHTDTAGQMVLTGGAFTRTAA